MLNFFQWNVILVEYLDPPCDFQWTIKYLFYVSYATQKHFIYSFLLPGQIFLFPTFWSRVHFVCWRPSFRAPLSDAARNERNVFSDTRRFYIYLLFVVSVSHLWLRYFCFFALALCRSLLSIYTTGAANSCNLWVCRKKQLNAC